MNASASFAALDVPALIARKRDGEALGADELGALVAAYSRDAVPDYQMSAWAMAVYLRGMRPEETTALTLAMRDSGQVLDWQGIEGVRVDKHSTGGVGDKVSLCLAPLVAACGVQVPMVSGRGLGHTGGTLDKLESIPGFSTGLSTTALQRQVARLGWAMAGQSAEIAPADRKLYALRDVTATVASVPLITASILSKKLAAGLDALVLDVKVGRGAFMQSEAEARVLAASLVQTAQAAGLRCSAQLTAMDQPLGRTIGNALECREAFQWLAGTGPEALSTVTFALGEAMLLAAGVAADKQAARAQLERARDSGAALQHMQRLVTAQCGDAHVVEDPSRLPQAREQRLVLADADGHLQRLDAYGLARVALALGAGRYRMADPVDPAAGIEVLQPPGSVVQGGSPLLRLHSSQPIGDDAVAAAKAACMCGEVKPEATTWLLGEIS